MLVLLLYGVIVRQLCSSEDVNVGALTVRGGGAGDCTCSTASRTVMPFTDGALAAECVCSVASLLLSY